MKKTIFVLALIFLTAASAYALISTFTAAEIEQSIGLAQTLEYGYSYLWIESWSNGDSPPDALNTSTRSPWKYRTFDSAAAEDLKIVWEVPNDIDTSGGVVFSVCYLVTASTAPSAQGVSFGLRGRSLADNDVTNGTMGTAVVVDDTGTTASQWDLLITPWSTDVTITGLSAGELAELKFYRDPGDSDDDYLQLVGPALVVIKYKRVDS